MNKRLHCFGVAMLEILVIFAICFFIIYFGRLNFMYVMRSSICHWQKASGMIRGFL